MENHQYEWKVLHKKKPHVETIKVLAHIVAVALSTIMAALGIGWLASVVTVLVSGKLLGYTVFFGIPPFVLSLLITAGLYVAYWPVALAAKGFWSIAKGVNRYKPHEIVTGAIFFALALATLFTIAVNLGRNINFEYRDDKTRVIIDDGNICVSDADYCQKY